MPGRKNLTDLGVANLKARASRYAHPDPQLSGHYIRVMPTGAKSYCAVANDPITGKQTWATISPCDVMGIEEARRKAQDALKRIRAGQAAFDPPPPKPDTLRAVSDLYIRRHVVAQKLRSRYEIERTFRIYIWPHLGDREFRSLRRSDIVALLDRVQDENGPRQADLVLAQLRSLCNWFAARHDDFSTPIVKGMKRSNASSRKRARILSDDELRSVWQVAESAGRFGAMIRLLLLTAQRREKIAAMRWSDLTGNEWQVPSEDRAKGVGGVLTLPAAAMAVIESLPRLEANPFVFAGRGKSHFSGFSKSKLAFDAKLPGMAPWVLHDLRRTARSLMSRAGVRPEIAERVMGHVIAGVEGVYDRHSYRDEKADAVERLACLIQSIINPSTGNVVPLAAARR